MIFTKRDTDLERGTGKPDLSLNFYGTNIGLIFDPSLTWTKNIASLVSRCKKPLNILKYVANKDWELTGDQ